MTGTPQNSGVTRLARPVVAIDHGHAMFLKYQFLVRSQSVDMLDRVNLTEVDDFMTRCRKMEIVDLQIHCRLVAFADGHQLIVINGLQSTICDEPPQCISLP